MKQKNTELQFKVNGHVLGNTVMQLKQTASLGTDRSRPDFIDDKEYKKILIYADKARSSWKNQFFFKEEVQTDGKIVDHGLRPAQIGAMHATLAHWKVSQDPATIVIPTGLGKTETMLSLLVNQQPHRVLVVVPTNALREQISDKFIELGILKDLGVIGKSAHFPVVGVMKKRFKKAQDVKKYFELCNVVVATMSVVGGSKDSIQSAIAHSCSHLFIDEAHHVSAPSWKKFKSHFGDKTILQFTATPFRNDGKLVDGKIVFNFPLKKAQEQGYFKSIKYKPVFEYDPRLHDVTIAEKAVRQLKVDLKKGRNHMLMARVDSVKRAEEVFKIYKKYSNLKPLQIHTGIKSLKDREIIRKKIVNKESRIVVCVDMLGEGFDLPELKVGAFHDVKKSLPVTLQLVGRFTRTRKDLGNPTFIANAADVDVAGELKKLYSQDADWNILLSQNSEKVTKEQVDLWEFLEGFNQFPEDIPLQNLRPAVSTVIYKTKCKDWTPENWEEGFKGIKLDTKLSDINRKTNTLVIITARKVPVGWAQIKDIYELNWELFIVYWDHKQNLLFINSSSNQGHFQNLAESVTGTDANLIKDYSVFRCFAGVNRLKLQNVGLIEKLGRLIKYTMRSGSDVESGLSEADIRTVTKANMFGIGYEHGKKTSVGCSYKGRVWSYRKAHLEQLVNWCRLVGRKVLDETINPDEILEGTLVPIQIDSRPSKMPICIDWPNDFYNQPETVYEFVVNSKDVLPLYETDIVLKDPSKKGDLVFEISNGRVSISMSLKFNKVRHSYSFVILGGKTAMIKYGNNSVSLESFFNENPPTIWFHDGSSLEGNSYTELKWQYDPYSVKKIQTWEWSGTNIQKESQGLSRDKTSVQFRVIENLKKMKQYDVIFDDDGPGEIGDVIAIQDRKDSISIEIYHCKFSKEKIAGGRIEDLYSVCGQAQKCVSWMERQEDIFKHLQRRDIKRISQYNKTRYMVGDNNTITKLINKMANYPVEVSVFVVQPGLSKRKVSRSQLELLSVTENYLLETYKLPFTMVASK